MPRSFFVALLLLTTGMAAACAQKASRSTVDLPGESGSIFPGDGNGPTHAYAGPDAAGNPISPNGYGPFTLNADPNWPTPPSTIVNLGEGARCNFETTAVTPPSRTAWEAPAVIAARGGAAAHTYESANFVFRWGTNTTVTVNGNAVDVQTLVAAQVQNYESRFATDCAHFGAGFCGTGLVNPHKLNVYVTGTTSQAYDPNVPESWGTGYGLAFLDPQTDPVVHVAPADLSQGSGAASGSDGLAYIAAFGSPLAASLSAAGLDPALAIRQTQQFFDDIRSQTTPSITTDYFAQRTALTLGTTHPNFDPQYSNYAWYLQTWAAELCDEAPQKISEVWQAAKSGDDFAQALARVARKQNPYFDLGNFFADYAARTALYDFHDHAALRSVMLPLRANHWAGYEWLNAVPTAVAGTYTIPTWAAPQPWGHNIIRLIPMQGATALTVKLTTAGPVTDAAALRGKLAILAADGTTRYSDAFSDGGSIALQPGNDQEVYLTVTAAPTTYKIYPTLSATAAVPTTAYDLTLTGAVPYGQEPYSPTYCDTNDPTTGHAHANGGGWVANTATVDPNAYVGPEAQVCGTGSVTGTARILDRAYVSGTVQGTAVVKNFATVTFGTVKGAATVADQAHVQDGTVSDSATINHMALISSGAAVLDGQATLTDYAAMQYTSHVSGSAVIGGHISVNETADTCSAGTHVDGENLNITATPCQ